MPRNPCYNEQTKHVTCIPTKCIIPFSKHQKHLLHTEFFTSTGFLTHIFGMLLPTEVHFK